MAFELPPLPYDYTALEPHIDEQTMRLHHDKHHAAYFNKTNALLQEAGRTPASLEEVVLEAARGERGELFNNAAQAWNHSLFWTLMSPDRSQPSGELASAIERSFGGLAHLKEAFVKAGAGQFGSGWVWLAAEGETLKVLATHDGDNPLAQGADTPLLGCDVWEHAYYLDYRNDRKAYLEAWFDALPYWEFAARQYAAARGEGESWRHPGPVSG